MHDYLTQPTVSESDHIVQVLNFLSCAVKDAPAVVYHDQLTAISNLRDRFCGWNPQQPSTLPDLTTPPHLARAPPLHPQHPAALPAPPPLRPPPRVATPTATPSPPPAPSLKTPLPPLAPLRAPATRPICDVLFRQKLPIFAELHPKDLSPPLRQSPRVHPSPAAPNKVKEPAPVAHRTRARLKLLPLAAASRTLPSEFIEGWAASEVLHGNQWSPLALSVLDPETGQSLEHRALRRHLRLGPDRNTSYSNELGRLCQGIGINPADPSKQHVEGTNNFHPIRYEDIPLD